jgi:hypothetical protein
MPLNCFISNVYTVCVHYTIVLSPRGAGGYVYVGRLIENKLFFFALTQSFFIIMFSFI